MAYMNVNAVAGKVADDIFVFWTETCEYFIQFSKLLYCVLSSIGFNNTLIHL